MRVPMLAILLTAGCQIENNFHAITDLNFAGGDTAVGMDLLGGSGTWNGGLPQDDTYPPVTGSSPGVGTDTDTDTVTITDTGVAVAIEEICETAAGLTGYLDAWQIGGDDRVYFCHNGSGANWVFIEASIASCMSHLDHAYDVFPSTGCDS